MRGKANIGDDIGDDFRITPAYAGKRTEWQQKKRCLGDHPRLCGEKRKKHKRLSLRVGSPPPMRGKEVFICSHEVNARITPAYAGKRYLLFVHGIDK